MKITTIEIEVVKMTQQEENGLWEEWQKHYTDKQDVYICGHKLLNWCTDDGDNQLLLQDKDGKEFYISVSREQ